MSLSQIQRDAFDHILEQVLDALPPAILAYFDEVPLVVEDQPGQELMRELEIEHPEDLCGLHDGVPLTEGMAADEFRVPDQITIYRRGILGMARDAAGQVDPQELQEQIRITVLHELGHHFGLDEDDLDALGYG
jgi:predicted Zn-dependent protease with MMP-like domain